MAIVWFELSSPERKLLQEYKNEIGGDYIYCMRVKASKESYDAIIKSRKLTAKTAVGERFPIKCNEVQWWDIPDNAQPEFSGAPGVDSFDNIVSQINNFQVTTIRITQ